MIDAVREKVKSFLKEALGSDEVADAIKIIEIDHLNGNWVTIVEVAGRDLNLPEYRVFQKERYVVKLTSDLDVTSYKRLEEGEMEE
ncbi:MAG TPA: hypothetical protein VL485_14940 [Ktedonobacteraceae bacterium]|jgi:hypothetical protein|nr:hypothetical protein [Ktedonobacteraceae bacterium]